MNAARQSRLVCWGALWLAAMGLAAVAQNTNTATTNRPPASAPAASAPTTASRTSPPASSSNSREREAASSSLDESAFRIVSERNVFNANRSGGQVRFSNSRRPSRVESFTLVGTIAYEKGAFAFFQGSSSELTKVLKPEGTIAGHKLVDILADGVKLEADGTILDLPVGSAMRREDEGTWQPGDAVASSPGGSSRRDDEDTSRSRGREDRRSDSDSRERSSPSSSTSTTVSSADQSEALKRLLERREKDSQ